MHDTWEPDKGIGTPTPPFSIRHRLRLSQAQFATMPIPSPAVRPLLNTGAVQHQQHSNGGSSGAPAGAAQPAPSQACAHPSNCAEPRGSAAATAHGCCARLRQRAKAPPATTSHPATLQLQPCHPSTPAVLPSQLQLCGGGACSIASGRAPGPAPCRRAAAAALRLGGRWCRQRCRRRNNRGPANHPLRLHSGGAAVGQHQRSRPGFQDAV